MQKQPIPVGGGAGVVGGTSSTIGYHSIKDANNKVVIYDISDHLNRHHFTCYTVCKTKFYIFLQ